MDIETYVNQNVDTILKEKRDRFIADGFNSLNHTNFSGTPLQNLTYPGIFVQGIASNYIYYYDF